MTHLNVATFRQNVGLLSVPPALWRGAATSQFGPREVYVLLRSVHITRSDEGDFGQNEIRNGVAPSGQSERRPDSSNSVLSGKNEKAHGFLGGKAGAVWDVE